MPNQTDLRESTLVHELEIVVIRCSRCGMVQTICLHIKQALKLMRTNADRKSQPRQGNLIFILFHLRQNFSLDMDSRRAYCCFSNCLCEVAASMNSRH
jgi:hypothetical protein